MFYAPIAQWIERLLAEQQVGGSSPPRRAIVLLMETNNIEKNWSVYILQCSDDTYYTGITNNIDKRLKDHNSKKASRYTAQRVPVKYVFCKSGYTHGNALKKEIEVKKWSRKKKEKFVLLQNN